jgi:Transcriptional regulator, AbiEi antitoxin
LKKYQEIFKQNGGVVQMQTLIEAGITYYSLNKMIKTGIVSKIKHGVYRLENNETPVDEMIEVARMVPNGVFRFFFCMCSLWIDYFCIIFFKEVKSRYVY